MAAQEERERHAGCRSELQAEVKAAREDAASKALALLKLQVYSGGGGCINTCLGRGGGGGHTLPPYRYLGRGGGGATHYPPIDTWGGGEGGRGAHTLSPYRYLGRGGNTLPP